MELKKLNLDAGEFIANGKKYVISRELSFNRYAKLKELMLSFGASASFQDIFQNLRKAWDLLNAQKYADGCVAIHNIMRGITELEQKKEPALRICALFINQVGEDITIYDEVKEKEKIEDWGKEYGIESFFLLASNLVPGWIDAYQILTQDTSAKARKK